MSDEDWRVKVELADAGSAKRLYESAGHSDLTRHARETLAERAALSHDGAVVFAYATTREYAEAAQVVLRELASEEGLEASFELMRWHPERDQWEDGDVPLEAVGVAHTRDQAGEAVEGHAGAVPEYEVRISFPAREDAIEFAAQLAAEGIPSARHWRHLLVGAWTEDDANALAERIRGEAPIGAEVATDLTGASIAQRMPLGYGPFVPF
ncbi:MAG TPA: hypothetical protein VL977_01140 [Solirubrobacteraceae bacterium]|nr:hypothetical protein [Solirubrobacteraceae bacterium]